MREHVDEAMLTARQLPLANGSRVDDLIDAIHAHGFNWGLSNGN